MLKYNIIPNTFTVGILLVVIALLPSCTEVNEKEERRGDVGREKIVSLCEIAGSKPSIISQDVIVLQKEVAETRRIDAAIALIKSLSLSLPKPMHADEIVQTELIPAIELLDKYFGKDVGPLLYAGALTTKNKWLRTRIALASRKILDKQNIEQLNNVFSLKNSTNPNAEEFLEFLNRPILKVDLPSSFPAHEQELIDKLNESLQRKNIEVPKREKGNK